MRVTTFIGAGAAIEIGGPTTNRVTQLVREKEQTLIDKRINFIEHVAKVLERQYGQPTNFEEIFHTLELISSYRTGWQGAIKKFTPFLTAFAKPRLTRFFKDDLALNLAKRDLIKTVAELIYDYDSRYLVSGKNKWHVNFWNEFSMAFKLDIATLNYDTCIEQSIPTLEDGFEKTEYQFERFNPKKLVDSRGSKIYHLHGCINYGYAKGQKPNEFTLEDNFDDVYKYKQYKEASQTWFGRSSNISQSSEEALIGPIITGLKKTDKVINYPYNLYYSEMQSAIINNHALLIIGYSFGDLHFNRLLERVVRIHGKKRRIVIVTKFTGKAWHPNWTAMGWPEQREMMVFASKAFQDYFPFRTGLFSGPPEVIISKDGCARIYLGGFMQVAEFRRKEILDFLQS